MSLFQEN
jgi:nicotinamide-nucleotide amidase